jgi:hypothetical protein
MSSGSHIKANHFGNLAAGIPFAVNFRGCAIAFFKRGIIAN